METIGSKRSYALIWCMPNNDDDVLVYFHFLGSETDPVLLLLLFLLGQPSLTKPKAVISNQIRMTFSGNDHQVNHSSIDRVIFRSDVTLSRWWPLCHFMQIKCCHLVIMYASSAWQTLCICSLLEILSTVRDP